MFKKGYIIVFVRQDNELHINWYNPEKHPVITDSIQLVKDEFMEGEEYYGEQN